MMLIVMNYFASFKTVQVHSHTVLKYSKLNECLQRRETFLKI